MRIKVTLLLLFTFSFLHSQNTDNWIFGRHAGLHFESNGDTTPFNGSSLNTREGCTSFSDSNGNLLFYSDGSTVWNKNHQIMPNGINLGGDDSSSQSGLTVPNPSNNDLFYLFTVGDWGDEGFYVSTIDISQDGGLGSVIGSSINLSDPINNNNWSEKITAVKRESENEYWVITFSEDTFYSFLITSSGLNTTPIVSSGMHHAYDARGYLKVSPNGLKLVSANMTDGTYLYNFDIETGIVSNEQNLNLNNYDGYGVEFSKDSNVLYVATGGYISTTERLFQFDLTSANINNSRQLIYSYFNSRAALQLASNGKIYWASDESYNISVINNPSQLGAACNLSFQTVNLGTNRSGQGLPPFIQSLFLETNILVENLELCDGDTYELGPDTSNYPATTTYLWYHDNVLLPNTSSSIILDNNTSLNAGTYRIEVNFNDGSLTLIDETIVQFYEYANVNTPTSIQICDIDSDGISNVDLTFYQDEISVGLNTDNFAYYFNQDDAENEENPIIDPSNFLTSNVHLLVRVETGGDCFVLGEIDISVTVSTISYSESFNECDDFLDIYGNNNSFNDDTDGIAQFDFSDSVNDIISLFPLDQQVNISIHFYHTLNEATQEINEVTDIDSYRNINSPNYERLYIRVNNNLNNECAGLGNDLFINLIVTPIPITNATESIRACDLNQDGFGSFDITNLESEIIEDQVNITLSYFNEDGSEILPTLPNPFYTESQIITIIATNSTNSNCSSSTIKEFIVDKTPYISQLVVIDPLCEDQSNGMSAFDTSDIESTILGLDQQDMRIRYFDENNVELSSPLPNPFITASQTISVIVENPLNTTCTVSTTIDFVVSLLPQFVVNDNFLCRNFLPDPLIVNIENPLDNYDYFWYNQDNQLIGDNASFLHIFEEGNYTVTASTQDGLLCSVTKEFHITETEIIEDNPSDLLKCDEGFNTAVFDLYDGLSISDLSLDVSFFISETDLENNQNQILNATTYSNTSNPQTIYLKLTNIYSNCYEKYSFKIETEDCPPIIPNAFSPNNDGNNDTFSIIGLHTIFDEYTIFIYNRYGNLVYEGSQDIDDWDGSYNGSVLPSGTYFYILKIVDKKFYYGSYRGWVYLNK